MTPADLRDTHDAPPDTDVWDDWFGGATPAEVAEVDLGVVVAGWAS